MKKPEDCKVLIGCEESGIFREAFLARGFDAWSCDLKPSRDGSNRHIRDDIRNVIGPEWDLMLIAHPPCTRLCNSGVRWLHKPPTGKTLAQMWADLEEGAALFSDCWNADVEHIGVENPVMHSHAVERIANYQKPHIVQPHWFGDPAFKATGWYLKNLDPLTPTNKLTPPKPGTGEHKAWSKVHREPPGPRRAEIRSTSFPGMAAAAARQWGDQVLGTGPCAGRMNEKHGSQITGQLAMGL